MKIGTIIFITLILTVLFGAVPLMIIGGVFEWLGGILKALGKALDIFGWGGILNFNIKGMN